MNLQPLFEKQRQLDQYIIKKKGLEGQDLLPNKILALQVELGELANEWRGFKHWSDNQEPKHGYEPLIECDKCGGKGFWFSGERIHCQKCKQTGKVTNPLLEELVDCLHFILSIGIETWHEPGLVEPLKANTGVLQQFLSLNQHVGSMSFAWSVDEAGDFTTTNFYDRYDQSLKLLLGLGEMLEFTFDEIEQAYNEKWEENIRRQDAGY
ncbi:dUTP diphosphatase [Brevibacillus sp. NPDC003359]|uniref:dUTP diphosphatase n=1 Tax=unclassified Brevibacillus TaxID=2684853 RepID=UPI00367EF29A